MLLEVLVEELSAEEAVRRLLPRLVGPDVAFEVHSFQGKRDLLAKLPERLRGYARWMASGVETRVVVLIDEDRQDCRVLKAQLDRAAADAGLRAKSVVGPGEPFVVLNRLAVEELEAWFFGDCSAVRAAYPGVPPTLEAKARFRHPDAIAGGTWEQLERVLQGAGHHRGGLAKVQAARDIARHMDPSRNTSPSFACFVAGVRALVAA